VGEEETRRYEMRDVKIAGKASTPRREFGKPHDTASDD
jgi:hypothetical protein